MAPGTSYGVPVVKKPCDLCQALPYLLYIDMIPLWSITTPPYLYLPINTNVWYSKGTGTYLFASFERSQDKYRPYYSDNRTLMAHGNVQSEQPGSPPRQGPTLLSPWSAPPLSVANGRALAFFSPCQPAPCRSQPASRYQFVRSSVRAYEYSYTRGIWS